MDNFRTSYWKEVAGTSYTAETATLMTQLVFTYKDENDKKQTTYGAWVNGANNQDGKFDVISFSFDSSLNVITFTNTGEQACFVIELEIADPNSIKTVKTEENNAPAYNIAGQQVGKDYKGVVIQNGRKVINK